MSHKGFTFDITNHSHTVMSTNSALRTWLTSKGLFDNTALFRTLLASNQTRRRFTAADRASSMAKAKEVIAVGGARPICGIKQTTLASMAPMTPMCIALPACPVALLRERMALCSAASSAVKLNMQLSPAASTSHMRMGNPIAVNTSD
jgi:hypothetical protein